MGRRSHGTESIYRRKDGLYVAEYRGQYRYSKTKATAKRKLKQMLQQSDTVQPSNITVGEVLNDYLQYAQQNLKPRTVTRYRIAVETHLMPAFGKVKLHRLTALQIETVYARKQADGLSASSIVLLHAVLSSAMKRAVRLSLVQTNVCKDVQTPGIRHDEVQVFDPSEVQSILSAAEYDPLRAVWVLALTTGARECELLGLQVQDYNSEQGTLAIRRTVYNGVVGTPKSRNGIRTSSYLSRHSKP